MVRGAFEYQGQKCSAASRVFVAESLWPELRDQLGAEIATITMGDIADYGNFMGAVIDRNAWETSALGWADDEVLAARLAETRG